LKYSKQLEKKKEEERREIDHEISSGNIKHV
jgi:hypothetical protein